MALDKTVLAAAIKAELVTNGFVLTNGKASDFIDCLCDALITHIKTLAVVSVSVVTTCPSGAGTGTGTGTIS
jgi:hypothetical protein